jgi:hypothetical protein
MVKRKITNNDLQNITHITKDRLMISHERGKDWEVFTSGTYPWSFVTQMFYQDFLDRGLLLTGKLLSQGFLLIKLKSSLRTFYGRHHNLIDRYAISVSQMN